MTVEPSQSNRPGRHLARLIYLRSALVAIAVASSTAAHAVTIELKDVASDRLERQRDAAEGNLPLAGTPDLAQLNERLAEKGLKAGSPVLLRAFKSESEFEVWVRKDDAFVLFATYPVCHWSGTLGPKLREGDKQTPEGFYTVTRAQMRHVGRWPRSLNLGFPNVFDKVQARNGSHILVHGGCSSVGCFAMTNSVIEEIYGPTEQAVAGGQTFVPVHVFPFRLTDANLATQKDSPWYSFWSNLKEGHDFVERTKRAPRVSVCEGRYKFQDTAPEEGADPGPLVPCGEARAALDFLERLPPAALTRLSLQMNPTVSAPRSLSSSRLSKPSLVNSNGHGNGATLPRNPLHNGPGRLGANIAEATGLPGEAPRETHPRELQPLMPHQLPCSMALASCRRFIALQQQAAVKRFASHGGRKSRQQHAQR
jgi:murein L,D-transpeptidase YafK